MDRATKIERVKQIRESALRLLDARGTWGLVGDRKQIVAKVGNVSLSYRTPFQPLPKVPEPLRYRRALLKGKVNLPYGLDVWLDRKKVLNLEWDAAGDIEILSYPT